MKMTAKATVDSVRLEMISDMAIKYPSDVKEQIQISDLLSNVDNLITLHQRKHKKLTNIKKALLKKMFV
jgi:type I restriction enzyme S subunit